ncbi:hypothetical protein Bca4012_082734 [Brassica carinata]
MKRLNDTIKVHSFLDWSSEVDQITTHGISNIRLECSSMCLKKTWSNADKYSVLWISMKSKGTSFDGQICWI